MILATERIYLPPIAIDHPELLYKRIALEGNEFGTGIADIYRQIHYLLLDWVAKLLKKNEIIALKVEKRE